MTIGRRDFMLGSLGAGLAIAAVGPRVAAAPDCAINQTATLQQAADAAARSGTPLHLPPGIYSTERIVLKSGTQIHGVPGRTVLRHAGGRAILETEGTDNVRLSGLVLDGGGALLGDGGALLIATGARHFDVSDCRITGSSEDGVMLRKVAGRIANCQIDTIAEAAVFSEDACGLEISHNHVHDCGDNGILVWRSETGEDGTLVNANRIERIGAESGGSGQNGNGVNVFRAGSVLISQNRIADCAFSAIRSSAASNCQMVSNFCARLGGIALCAEIGFQGAVVANNVVDAAAMGVSVTNFNECGRHALVQGNTIRNLFLRKAGDTRGVGIGVDADAVVTGNVIEGAPAYGIFAGWHEYLRDVRVTDNVIRKSHVGIAVSVDPRVGSALIADNLIDGAKGGAIRTMEGPKPVGSDLARKSAEACRNIAVYANVAR
jgi:uncharacterized secreted repeat protein (TIGR03808 family)